MSPSLQAVRAKRSLLRRYLPDPAWQRCFLLIFFAQLFHPLDHFARLVDHLAYLDSKLLAAQSIEV
jgi:hypothetical protein